MIKTGFNDNWLFCNLGEETKSEVCLPHDAMLREKRSNLNPGGKNSAWFEGADYVYEKNFFLPLEYSDKKIIFEFEGVYRNCEVYINNEKSVCRPYGYTNFYAQASSFNFGGQNTIKVIAHNADQPNSRWYSGAGIYRPVWMYALDKEHIALNGVKIRTISVNPAKIEIQAVVEGSADVRVEIYDGGILAAGETAAANKDNSSGRNSALFQFDIENAKLWDSDNPHLYNCKVKFKDDEQNILFGIRKIECDAKGGFRINGKRVILRGACIHHDNGLLGAASHPSAEYRKIKILKENGYNAVRSAHNPCSKALLDACDSLGMLVLDEYADMWFIHKTKYDYAGLMQNWWKQDLQDMADKDFNHPSVIMYSIGNEVSETAYKQGIELTGEMTDFLYKLDNTRPVTCGINIFFNYLSTLGFGVYSNEKAAKESKKPKKDKAVGSEFYNNLAGLMGDKFMKFGATLNGSDRKTKEAFSKLDIAGYNYGIWRYKKDFKKYPNRVILGTETFCFDAYDFWESAKLNPALIGDFVWAGIDYMGEVGIGSWVYRDYAPDFKGGCGWLTAGSGRIDITGKPTCEAAYTKVAFELDKIRIGVVPANNGFRKHSPSAWKMSNAVESWSWEGCSGNRTRVEVYARAHRVDLYINEKKYGSKKINNSCICKFNVKYDDGNITAVSYDKGNNEIARTSLYTAGKETKITLTPEVNKISKDDLCFVRISFTDARGNLKPLIRGTVKVRITDGALLGLGHACPYNPDGYLADTTDTYLGEALAIVKPDGKGTVKVFAESQYGNAEAEVEIK